MVGVECVSCVLSALRDRADHAALLCKLMLTLVDLGVDVDFNMMGIDTCVGISLDRRLYCVDVLTFASLFHSLP
eukprot:3287588-Pleurochrysis_carterae.AAC.1